MAEEIKQEIKIPKDTKVITIKSKPKRFYLTEIVKHFPYERNRFLIVYSYSKFMKRAVEVVDMARTKAISNLHIIKVENGKKNFYNSDKSKKARLPFIKIYLEYKNVRTKN